MIGGIILQPKSRFHFYSTDLLSAEIQEHKKKLKLLAGFSDSELESTILLITNRIRFIDVKLLPTIVLIKAQELLTDIDIDDTEFVALTNHIRGKLWSGDKVLQKGLKQKGWEKFISANELYEFISKK
jgi:predicted nucleic acid-binding protein